MMYEIKGKYVMLQNNFRSFKSVTTSSVLVIIITNVIWNVCGSLLLDLFSFKRNSFGQILKYWHIERMQTIKLASNEFMLAAVRRISFNSRIIFGDYVWNLLSVRSVTSNFGGKISSDKSTWSEDFFLIDFKKCKIANSSTTIELLFSHF